MYLRQSVQRLVCVDTIVIGIDAVRPKNFYFPGESHDFWEAVLVCEGNATVTADERVYRLNSGKLVFHKPMEFHRIWAEQDSSPHLMILSFRASGVGMKRFENSCFDLNDKQRQQFAQLTACFPKAVPSGLSRSPADPLRLNYAAALLEVFLLELMKESQYDPVPRTEEELQYAKIVQVMKEHCEGNLSVAELAQLCHLGVSNMKRIFALFSDVGIAKYFCSLKIRRAMELLDSGMRASDVAEALHFTDASYFYTVFKRETGRTPSQYKKAGALGCLLRCPENGAEQNRPITSAKVSAPPILGK